MTPLYIYQTVHLAPAPARGHRARLVAEHAAMLDAASRTIFWRPYLPDIGTLTEHIEALAAAERYARGVSGFVRIELTAQGERLVGAGGSLYTGYALRSLRPDAVSVQYDLPIYQTATSASEAAGLLARQVAQNAGAEVAVRYGTDGVVYSADNAPLLAVRGRQVMISPAGPSVVRSLAIRAVRAAGLELVEKPILHTELERMDELFWVDHVGVCSILHCDSHPYMSLLAARVAQSMECLFTEN